MAYPEKRATGWRVRWQLPDKTPAGRAKEGHEDGFPSKAAALKYGRDQEAAIRAGTWIDPARGKTLLRDWWAEWFPVQRFRPNTAEAYAQQYRKHIEPRWGGVPLNAIRGLDVQAWFNTLGETLSASTLTVIRSAMSRALDDAVFNELITKSPMPPKGKRGVRVGTARQREGVVIPLSEIEAILARMRGDDERLIIIIALFTGLRWSEIAGMRRKYLTLIPPRDGAPAAGEYVIDPQDGAVHEDVHGHRFTGPPKSGPGRILDLPPFLVLLLAAYIATLPVAAEILFPNTRRTYRQYDTWNSTRWRPACDGRPAAVSAKGRSVREAVPPVHPGLRFHDLKHTHKAIMNDLRIHPAMQDYRLGHITPGTPGRYSHPTEQMRRELIEGLQETWEKWTAGRPTPIPLPAALETSHSDNLLF
jgi:integrase